MREIPSLKVLSVRALGSHKCSVETTFSPDAEKNPSQASKLLRSFHRRNRKDDDADDGKSTKDALDSVPIHRIPCIGTGSFRREHANDVDLFHPIIGCREKGENSNFIMDFGNPALDCLQSYIDSLVETSRMDDSRVGKYFFEEYKANIILGSGGDLAGGDEAAEPSPKRRRTSQANAPRSSKNTPLGSLSLYNCTLSKDTVNAMLESGLGPHLAVLDMTGVHSLHDDVIEPVLPQLVNLKRFSLKNCRCLTVKTLRLVAQYQANLESLDIGGAFNVTTQDVLEVLPMLTKLTEVHVSGIGWTDETLDKLVSLRKWRSLSLNFSLQLSQAALRTSLMKVADTLTAVALAFCESVVDNTLLGMLGRNLPNLRYLDVRGNGSLTTLTGWYDGRASADLPDQPLLVLGRYSGLTPSNVEDTKRIHPHVAKDLEVIFDGGGMGRAILRETNSTD